MRRYLLGLAIIGLVLEGGVAGAAAKPPPGLPIALGYAETILYGGYAYAPATSPLAVRQAVAAGNSLLGKPYIWGGGHGSWIARGYDCSGSVSFVLHRARLLNAPLVSGALASYGAPGPGRWITIYANGTHTFMFVAGLRFDTSGAGGRGPRWRVDRRTLAGFAVRHPRGL